MIDAARAGDGARHGWSSGGWTPARWRIALALLVIASFAIRARYLGNPFIDVDEQFYLLTGDRLLNAGALPYVDIWDRKPLGLFLLYAAIRLLGGVGIVQYQLVASGFAAATAVMIAVIARRIATPATALLAALAYIPALAMNAGQGGQTPVFYNLLMAIAAWLLTKLVVEARARRLVALGAGAMLLVGIAMQIKYNAVFEGVFFGCTLIRLGRRAGMRAKLPAATMMWAGLAALPTGLAWIAYAATGHGDAFVQANFLSILRRGSVGEASIAHDLPRIMLRLLPFILTVAIGQTFAKSRAPWQASDAAREIQQFLLGWLAAAAAGFVLFGGYLDHYALPLLPPLAILSAPVFAVGWRWIGPATATLVLGAMFVAYPLDARRLERRHLDAAYAQRMAAEIAPRLHGRCLYVFNGEPILYLLTHSCLPTRWVFPFHLSFAREQRALGVDPEAEVRRILATRPPVIVTRGNPNDEINPATLAILNQSLARNYRLAWHHAYPHARTIDQVWELNPPAAPSPH